MTEAYVLAGELEQAGGDYREPSVATSNCCDRSSRESRSRPGTSPLRSCRRRGSACGFATR